MFLITRWTRVITVTVFRLDATVTALDNKLALLVLCNPFCIFDSIALIIESLGCTAVTFAVHIPRTPVGRYPLILVHAFTSFYIELYKLYLK